MAGGVSYIIIDWLIERKGLTEVLGVSDIGFSIEILLVKSLLSFLGLSSYSTGVIGFLP